jgi:DNA polymerase-3 subunit gamma/tau
VSYLVFARKYRPQTFAEVVGQDHITRTLENAIKLGRLAQAYIFVGPRGTGKTSTARILAKALNCSNGPRVDFDPNEDICQEIAEGRCLDVLEIDGASNNSVEQVRELRDNCRFAPARGRFKIYYIDEVHMLSAGAFNALLKTLEEPPAHVKFIFATTEAHKVPATILSRCQRFDLRRIPDALIAQHLAKICGLEKVDAEPGALQAIARYAEGGLRDAESALDQTISFYGDKLTAEEVTAMFGLTGLEPVAELAEAIAKGDPLTALAQARALISSGKDLSRLTGDLLRFYRNVAVYQASPEAIKADCSDAEFEAVARVSPLVSRTGALAILEEITQSENRLRYALAKEVLFEVGLLQLTRLRERVSIEAVLAALGSSGSTEALPAPVAAPAVPKPTAAPELSPTRPPAATPAPAAAMIKNPAGIWEELVVKFGQALPLEKATLEATKFLQLRGDTFEVGLPSKLKPKLAFLTSPKPQAVIQEALQGLVGRPMQVAYLLSDSLNGTAVVAEGKAAEPEAPGPKLSDEEFKSDPLIKQALELFQGKIVSIKAPTV